MVLKFKYLSEDGRLESYQNYTIAQNSSLSNSIVVTSTDPNAHNYKYCLEFLCYNYKNVPKTQYISPILEYSQEGIEFAIPANLTQYKGHVDMQLTGYSPDDNKIVFKSINKSAKAFDVEGSLNVLESDIANTPNILTEFFDELAFYRNTRDELAQTVRQETEEKLAVAAQRVEAVVQEVNAATQEIETNVNTTFQEINDNVNAFTQQIDQKISRVNVSVDSLSKQVADITNSSKQGIINTAESAKQELSEIVDSIKQDFATIRGEIAETVKKEIIDSVQGIIQGDVFYKITFRINGEVIKSYTVREGVKVQQPEFTLPNGCEVVEGWYDMSQDRLWDFDEDGVVNDVVLTLNYMSAGIGMSAAGKIKDFANLTGDIYLPDYYNGKRVTHTENTVTNLSDGVNLHFGYNLTYYLGILSAGSQVKNLYFPKDSKMRNRANGIYTDKAEVGLVSFIFTPRDTKTLYIQSDCQELGVYAISHNPNLTKIVIPPTVTSLGSYCITNTGITTITIPASVTYCNTGAFYNNVNLQSIYIEGDMSEIITSASFVDRTQTTMTRPTLYVRPEHYQKYINRKLHNYYTINVMSKEYLDANYSAKEE
ncbi:MAG: leucine-rich repeat protein [Clostridia bacterium]|nr:leucine-rich repeat protein [Clostridia bacterium]